MNNTLEVLNTVLAKKEKGSYINHIRKIFTEYNFTDRQKQAAEIFLFDPTRENAIKALKQTPKVCAFLKNYFDEDTLVQELVRILQDKETNRTYLKTLFSSHFLEPILLKILPEKISKVRAYEMEMSLQGTPFNMQHNKSRMT